MVKITWSKQAIEDIYKIQEFYSSVATNFSLKLVDQIFEKEKLIIINRTTDKIKNLIDEIIEKKIDDIIIILNSNSMEKKGLRMIAEPSEYPCTGYTTPVSTIDLLVIV